MTGNLELLGKEGVIANYKRGRHLIHPKHCILYFEWIKSKKEAVNLIGKTVEWLSPSGRGLKGNITRLHGNKGAVIAHFKKAGLPGQALGQKVKIIKL
jgi:ribosomal protein L35AE/L33A